MSTGDCILGARFQSCSFLSQIWTPVPSLVLEVGLSNHKSSQPILKCERRAVCIPVPLPHHSGCVRQTDPKRSPFLVGEARLSALWEFSIWNCYMGSNSLLAPTVLLSFCLLGARNWDPLDNIKATWWRNAGEGGEEGGWSCCGDTRSNTNKALQEKPLAQ